MPENPYKSPQAEGRPEPVRVFRAATYGAGIGFITGLVVGTSGWLWVSMSSGEFEEFTDYELVVRDAWEQTVFNDAPIFALLGLGGGFALAVSKKILRRLMSATR